MGFLDKAKQMAEQAQAKLDEAQKQFHAAQGGDRPADDAPAVEDEQHGRPVPQTPPATASPPQGDPLAGATPSPRAAGPVPDPQAPPTGHAPPPHGDPNHPSYAPPDLTSGDPLQG